MYLAQPASVGKPANWLGQTPSGARLRKWAVASVAGVCLAATAVPAGVLTWDADPTTLGAQDGSGIWSSTATNWWNGIADTPWNSTNGDSAVFGVSGVGGVVTLGGDLILSNLTFNTSYTLLQAFTLSFTNGGGIVTAAAGTSNAIPQYFGGASGWSLEGGGTISHNISGNDRYTGLASINNGTVWVGGNDTRAYFSGDVLVNTNGKLVFTSGGSSPGQGILGGSKVLILNGGTLFGTSSTKYLQVNKMVMDNGGIMDGLSITIMTNLDARSGFIGGGRGVGRYSQCTLSKSTAGTLTITNQPYATGVSYSNVTLNAGDLVFDKSVEKTAKKISGPVILGGGSLVLSNGNVVATAAGAENGITATTVKPGASTVKSLTLNGAAANGAIALAAIARQTGGTLNAMTNSSGNTITTTSANNNGILGGWAIVNGADWAVGPTLAPFAGYNTSADPTTWASTDNVSLSGSPVADVGAGSNINSLKLAGAATVTLDGTLTLTSGGLLVTGGGATSITGGTLLAGPGADLIVYQNASADLSISSSLADNGSPASLTKSGGGKLVLSPTANTMTGANYLNAGVVEVNDLAGLAAGPIDFTGGTLRYIGTSATENRAITLNGLGGTFDVNSAGTTLTLSANIGNSDGLQPANSAAGVLMGNLGGLTKVGAGTLALAGSNYFNGLALVSAGTLLVNGTNAYDVTTFGAGKVTVAGGTLGGTGLVGGAVAVNSGATIAPGVAIGTLTLATNLSLQSGAASVFDVVNAPGASDLLVVQGNLNIAAGNAITLNVSGAPLTAGTYTLIQYAGTRTGSFNSVPVIASGSINGSYAISDTTPGQINLVVTPQVTITAQPADTVVSTNDPASFSVIATGQAPITYQWYFYGEDGTAAPTLQPDATNATFTIASAQFSDSGYYGVVAENGINSVTSRLALLIVGNVLPVLSGPTNVTVIAGSSYTFNTRVVIANPPPTLQWLTNGISVPGATTTALTFNNIPYALDGTAVSVIASNVVGMVTNSALLTVIVAPSITTQPTNTVVNEGDPAELAAAVSGVPTPTLQWYKNDAALPGATSATLNIASAQGSNIGTYYLAATNAAGGAVSASALLVVNSTNLVATAFSPANGATAVCYDTPLYVTFNETVSIRNSGRIRIFNVTNITTPVDVIDMGSNTVVISTLNSGQGILLTNNIQPRSLFPGDNTAFNYFPVIINSNVAAIYPHSGVLTSNQTYYVTLDNGIVASPTGAYFAGISNSAAWRFTTKPTGPANPTNLVVAADGSGDFATVQGAVDNIPLNNSTYRLINIRNGNYVEIVNVSSKSNITFRGQSRLGTVVGYGNNANIAPGGSTGSRMAFKINGNDIAIENLTVVNRTPQGGSQAEALMINTGASRFILNNADVNSLQDTILANVNSAQGYFYQSTVRGNFDYIWGGGNLFFTNCLIYTVPNIYVTNNYNLDAARTDFSSTSNATTHWLNPSGSYTANGFSYVNCSLQADPAVNTITLEGANGTANGLVSFTGCLIDTNHYVTPVSSILSSYVLWEHGNSNVDGSLPVSLGLTVLPDGDQRLLAAANATNWLYGWRPALAPNILTNPASQTVTAGDSVSLTVSATGIPNPAYQWLKNGTNLASATNATLAIAIAHLADSGIYSVIVTTPAGSATSATATLTVNPHPNTAPPVFTAPANGSVFTNTVGITLFVTNTATDADMPAETISFSQLSGSGSITPDGLYAWRPQVNDAGKTNVVVIVVSDDGAPILSATNTFSVIVNSLNQPNVSSANFVGGQFTLTVSADVGPDYAVQTSTDLVNWGTLFITNSPPSPFQWSDPGTSNYPARFYRLKVGPPLP